jgi:peptidyl-prolyl cis-trans isomerase D
MRRSSKSSELRPAVAAEAHGGNQGHVRVSKRGGTGIAENSAVVEAAFSEDVLLNGNNSAPIEIAPDHIVVLRVQEHQEASQQPLEQVRADVEQLARDKKARELAAVRGKELLDELTTGKTTLDDVAVAEKLTPHKTGLILRNAAEPAREIVTAAFSMQSPAEGETVYDGLATRGGDYVIIALEQIKEGNISDLPEAARQQAWRGLSQLQGEAEMAAVMTVLKDQAVIDIPPSSDQ